MTREGNPFMRSRLPAAVAVCLLAVLLGGCGPGRDTGSGPAPHGFPMTVTNCGVPVTLEKPPRRVVIVGNEEVPLLAGVGALDRVVGKAGLFPRGLFGRAADEALARVPTLGSGVNSEGTSQASLESVVAMRPDLVIGYETPTITRTGLSAAGIPMIVDPSFCTDGAHRAKHVSFRNVYDQAAFYGRLFGEQARAARDVARLKARVHAVRTGYAEGTRTAAALYLGKSAGTVQAYGSQSMANAEIRAAGLRNAFGSVDDRVFAISTEQLIAKDPDVLILLSADPDVTTYRDQLLSVPGTSSLSAVREGNLLAEQFGYADPPTQLTVTGLENLARRFGARQ